MTILEEWIDRARVLWAARWRLGLLIAAAVMTALGYDVVLHGWHAPSMASTVVWIDPKAREVRARLESREAANLAGVPPRVATGVVVRGLNDTYDVVAVSLDPTEAVTSANNLADYVEREARTGQEAEQRQYLEQIAAWRAARESQRKDVQQSLDRVTARVAELAHALPAPAGSGVVIVGQTPAERQLERVLETMRTERSALFYELLALEREGRGGLPQPPAPATLTLKVIDHATRAVVRPTGRPVRAASAALTAAILGSMWVLTREALRRLRAPRAA